MSLHQVLPLPSELSLNSNELRVKNYSGTPYERVEYSKLC